MASRSKISSSSSFRRQGKQRGADGNGLFVMRTLMGLIVAALLAASATAAAAPPTSARPPATTVAKPGPAPGIRRLETSFPKGRTTRSSPLMAGRCSSPAASSRIGAWGQTSLRMRSTPPPGGSSGPSVTKDKRTGTTNTTRATRWRSVPTALACMWPDIRTAARRMDRTGPSSVTEHATASSSGRVPADEDRQRPQKLSCPRTEPGYTQSETPARAATS